MSARWVAVGMLGLVLMGTASAQNEIATNNDNTTYQFNPKATKIWVNFPGDCTDADARRIMTSQNPVQAFEAFLRTKGAANLQDEMYALFRLAIEILASDKKASESYSRYVICRGCMLQSYPYKRKWIQQRPDGSPDVIITTFKTAGKETLVVNHALLHDNDGTVSLVFGSDARIANDSLDAPEEYVTLGLSEPEFRITLSQSTARTYDKAIQESIERLSIRGDDHFSVFTQVSPEQRDRNLQEIMRLLHKLGCPERLSRGENVRNMLELASLENAAGPLERYLTEVVRPYLERLYPSPPYTTNARKHVLCYQITDATPVIPILQLMKKHGEEAVFEKIRRLRELAGICIGGNESLVSLLAASLESPELIEGNIVFLKAKGMDFGKYNGNLTNAEESDVLVQLISSPDLPKVITVIQKARPDVPLFEKGGSAVLDPMVRTGNGRDLVLALIASSELRLFVSKHPNALRGNVSLLILTLATLKQSGKLDEYHQIVDRISRRYPSVLKNTEGYEVIGINLTSGKIDANSLDDDFSRFVDQHKGHGELDVYDWIRLHRSYQNPELRKSTDVAGSAEFLSAIARLNKEFGVPMADLTRCAADIDAFYDFMFALEKYREAREAAKILGGIAYKAEEDPVAIQRDAKMDLDIICRHGGASLKRKYETLSNDKLFVDLGLSCQEEDLERTLSSLEARWETLAQVRKKITEGTDFDFKYKSLDEGYLSKCLSLDDGRIVEINEELRKIQRAKKKLGDPVAAQMAAALIDQRMDGVSGSASIRTARGLAKIVKEDLCDPRALLFKDIKDDDIYPLVNSLLAKANHDERRVKTFLDDIAAIGIRANGPSDLAQLGPLFGNEKVSTIARNRAFLQVLRDKSGEQDLTVANWGTLETLHDNPRLRNEYTAWSRESLVRNIGNELAMKFPVNRQEQGQRHSATQLTEIKNLNYLNLISIRMLLDFIRDHRDLVAKNLLKDCFDERTEHGGLFLAKDGQLNMVLDYDGFRRFKTQEYTDDRHYLASEAFVRQYRGAVSGFHFHAVLDTPGGDRSAFSGPSGFGGFFDPGDFDTATRHSRNGIQFCLFGLRPDPGSATVPVSFNAVWYGPGGDTPESGGPIAVDLGSYESAISVDEYTAIRNTWSLKPTH